MTGKKRSASTATKQGNRDMHGDTLRGREIHVGLMDLSSQLMRLFK